MEEDAQSSSPFSHPVFKTISSRNGEVNHMNRQSLEMKLQEFGLDPRGTKDVLKKRLKNCYKKEELRKAAVICDEDQSPIEYYMVIDFEATCDEGQQKFPHEIIEFPVILVHAKEFHVVDTFHSYVKPVVRPKLTQFCTSLTGISQSTVDSAKTFPTVLDQMHLWMETHSLGTEHPAIVVTDGPWDMNRFLYLQCKLCRLPYPKWARRWVNIRKVFSNYYHTPRINLTKMLEHLGQTFEGTLHSGIDDSRNIAQILITLLKDGAPVYVNEQLSAHKYQVLTELRRSTRKANKGHKAQVELSQLDESQRPRSKRKQRKSSADDVAQVCRGVEHIGLEVDAVDSDDNIDDLLSYYALRK